jgi:alpha-amylase/alpha-mannosidase (GH57 family)
VRLRWRKKKTQVHVTFSLLTSDVAAIKQTATILALDIKKDETKDNIAKEIVNFLMEPTGKTFEEVQKDEPEGEEAEDEELGEEVCL